MSIVTNIINESNNIFSKPKINYKDLEKLEKICNKQLGIINENLKQCILIFNTIICDISTILVQSFPNDQNMFMYNKYITSLVESNPVDPISTFILNIYCNDTYKKYILEGNDKFFVESNHEDITTDDKKIKTMFQFKSCWKMMDDNTKNYIKNSLKTLVDVSEKYIIEKDDGNRIAKIIEKLVSVMKTS